MSASSSVERAGLVPLQHAIESDPSLPARIASELQVSERTVVAWQRYRMPPPHAVVQLARIVGGGGDDPVRQVAWLSAAGHHVEALLLHLRTEELDVPALIARHRLRTGMTLADIAAQVGTAPEVVSRWARGRYQPRLPQAVALAAVLDVPVELVAAAAGLDPDLAVAMVCTEDGDRSGWSLAQWLVCRLADADTTQAATARFGASQLRRWKLGQGKPSEADLVDLCDLVGLDLLVAAVAGGYSQDFCDAVDKSVDDGQLSLPGLLRRRLASEGLTRAELADELGVARATVDGWVAGTGQLVSQGSVLQLAARFRDDLPLWLPHMRRRARPSGEFGLDLYRWRVATHSPRSAAAVTFDVSAATVAAWEAGRTTPSARAWPTIADAFGLEVSDLVERYGWDPATRPRPAGHLHRPAPVAPLEPGKFGPALRRARQQAGLTLQTVAERYGVSHQAISALERSRSVPTGATVRAAAGAVGRDPVDLLVDAGADRAAAEAFLAG